MGRPWGGRDPIQPLHSEAAGENAHGVSDHALDVRGIPATVCEPGDYQAGLGWLVWRYDWFYGEDIAGRYPPPTLMYAERNAWRKIHDLVHGGESLVTAMKNIKADLLFWTREVYERVTKAAAKGNTAKGKGKTKNTSRPALSVYQPQWEKPRKGDQKGSPPKGGGKTQSKGQKGKTKGKPDWPAHWAFRNPKQVSYCRDFHLYKTCEGQCGRSHNCPVRVNGWICDAPPSQRSAAECPHKPKWQAPPQVPLALQTRGQRGLLLRLQLPRGAMTLNHHRSRGHPPGGRVTPQLSPGWITSHRGFRNASNGNRWIPPRSPPQWYSGKDDAGSLDACVHAYHPHLSPHVISVDKRRDPGSIGNDMLKAGILSAVSHIWMTRSKSNCDRTIHTTSFVPWPPKAKFYLFVGGLTAEHGVLRWFPKPNAPPPVRGRSEAEVWGLEALTDQVQGDVDDDSVLMLRQFYLTSLAYQGLEQRRPPIKGGSWVEHPSDPSTSSMSPSAWRCSSIWNTQAYKLWAKHLKHRQVNFDECMLGQVSAKPTTISTDLELAHWHQMFCQHDRHQVDPSLKSSDLSRYPWDMMRGLNHCTRCCPNTPNRSQE